MPPVSDAHRHFKEVRDESGVVWHDCIHCPVATAKRYARKTSTDILNRHVAQCHPTHSRQARPSSQRSIEEMTVVTDNGAFKAALAHFFARCSLAHRIAELDECKELIDRARRSTCEVPKRAALRQSQLTLAQSLRRRVVHQLRTFCRSSPLTIAIDGWTNVSTAKVTNVVALCGGQAYYWCSIVNASNHNTAAWLSQPLVEAMNCLRSHGLVFAAMVADNEQVNKVLHNLVSITFPFLVRAPCAAHLVQLCVLKSLELPAIEPILETMVALLRQFRSKVLRLKLKAMQEAGPSGLGAPLNLLRPCDTRWSSQLYAAQRLLRLKSFVDIVLPQTPQFWADLISICGFLKPFQVATDVLQSDRATLYDAYLQYKDLIVHVNAIAPTSLFGPAVGSLREIMHDMWEKHVTEEAVIACALLAFDSHVNLCFAAERTRAAVEWLHLFAARYALYWHLTDNDSPTIEELRQQAKSEWSDFVGRTATSSFSGLDGDIIDIRAVHDKEQRRFDARSVWHLHSAQAPVIAHAAVALLSISSSEAAVERTFSAQGDVHSDRRNRLGDDTVEAEMFIKFNERTVTRAEESARMASSNRKKPVKRRRQAERDQGCAEMVDSSDDSDDDLPSIQGIFTRPVVAAAAADEQGVPAAGAAPDLAVDDAAPVVRFIPPEPVPDPVQAFIEQYVRDNPIHSRFRWKDYQLQRLEAAGAAWQPPMRDTPDQLRKRIMAWVRSEEYRELQEAEGGAREEEEEKENAV